VLTLLLIFLRKKIGDNILEKKNGKKPKKNWEKEIWNKNWEKEIWNKNLGEKFGKKNSKKICRPYIVGALILSSPAVQSLLIQPPVRILQTN